MGLKAMCFIDHCESSNNCCRHLRTRSLAVSGKPYSAIPNRIPIIRQGAEHLRDQIGAIRLSNFILEALEVKRSLELAVTALALAWACGIR